MVYVCTVYRDHCQFELLTTTQYPVSLQLLTYNGFYDANLEWVGLEGVQIVASVNPGGSLGRHQLSTRFTSIVRLCCVDYPDSEQLQAIYGAYLRPVLHHTLRQHPVWGSVSKIHMLAGSMVAIYDRVSTRIRIET